MKLTELLTTPEHIRQGVVFSSKKRLFESIAAFIVSELSCDKGEQACFECLFNREKLGNSGLGNGIAMPKGKLPKGIDKPIAIFMQLDSPIDYDAADGKPVDLVFALLIPGEQCSQYIPVLSSVSEKLTDKNLIKQLRAAQSAAEIWQIFQATDSIESIKET
ncbi:PTS IIA-like nitrogen regulatory protein PtsN [Rodentibacter caecimuris]|uniref:PTS IIA-like nitrogen-regulatory protein PtsN n=1 Tax=Rodentibacter caecimuris TaxID=1796644 RepID=A0ABX3L0X9_9PAST|nr:PTS IIA-like nitrogen-regulatory protein PtsN [Rodentibacter heylii]